MSKLIKRKDGSYSKRGLWDNIRKNKGSGKEPTKEMLKQESKIKKEENMKSMYKKGGKKMKGESFMEESKEIDFQAPGVKPPKKYAIGGLLGDPRKGPVDKNLQNPNPPARPKEVTDAINSSVSSKKNNPPIETGMEATGRKNRAEAIANMAGKKMMGGKYKKGGFPDLNKDGKTSFADVLKGRGVEEKMMGGKMYKKGGKKTMEPGGGGRFAAMVGKLKSKGKSEESAEAIAASAGRKKYGKSRFQAMAAAGKKKMMGGKKC